MRCCCCQACPTCEARQESWPAASALPSHLEAAGEAAAQVHHEGAGGGALGDLRGGTQGWGEGGGRERGGVAGGAGNRVVHSATALDPRRLAAALLHGVPRTGSTPPSCRILAPRRRHPPFPVPHRRPHPPHRATPGSCTPDTLQTCCRGPASRAGWASQAKLQSMCGA